MQRISAIFALLLPALAAAQPRETARGTYKTCPAGLTGVALNAAEAARTLTLEGVSDYSQVAFIVDFTRSAATNVSLTPQCRVGSGSWSPLPSTAFDAGDGAVSPIVLTRTTSTTGVFSFAVGLLPVCEDFRAIFAGASADGSDLITVTPCLGAGY